MVSLLTDLSIARRRPRPRVYKSQQSAQHSLAPQQVVKFEDVFLIATEVPERQNRPKATLRWHGTSTT